MGEFPQAAQRPCSQQSKLELVKLNWREIDNYFLRKDRQKLIVDQLRRQNSMKRILVSDAIGSLVDHIVSHEKDDLLLQGSMVKNKGMDKRMENNPFRMRPNKAASCVL